MFINRLLELPLGVYTFFGAPGKGKTTFAAAICHAAQLKGIPVYSNVPIIGAYEVTKDEIGHYNLPLFNSKFCILIVDEGGMQFNNREWKKNFDSDSLEWWLLHRHRKCMVYAFSQGYGDLDLKIRNLTQQYFIINRRGHIIYAKPIYYETGVNEERHEMQDLYSYDESKVSNFFNCTYIWGKKYWKMFDSFDAPPLPDLRLRKYASKSAYSPTNEDEIRDT